MPTFTTFMQHSMGSPSHSKCIRKKKKGTQIGKEEVKLSLFADDMILYVENLKDVTKKLLELINEYSKFEEYRINIQKSVVSIQ